MLAIALENLARAIAPVLCHMAEDIWQAIPYPTPHKSVFQAGWVTLEDQWKAPEEFVKKWETLRQIRAEVNKVLEKARTEKYIGSSLEAKVLLFPRKAKAKIFEQFDRSNSLTENGVDELRYLFLTSQVSLVKSPGDFVNLDYQSDLEDLTIGIAKADGEKCDRCWNYSSHVGESHDHPLLCERCVPIVTTEVQK